MSFTKARSEQAQRSIVAVFFIQGFLMTTQIPRIPEIIKQIGVDFTAWGLIIGVAGLGGLLGLLFTNRFISRFGTKNISIIGCLGLAVTMASFGFIHDPVTFFIAQAANSFLGALFNIAVNSQTVALQKVLNRVIIGKFHAAWAIGATISASLSGLLSTFMPLWLHLLLVPAALILALGYFSRGMLTNAEDGHGQGKPKHKPVSFFKSPPQVWLLAAGLFTGVMCEVTMMDWSAVFSQDAVGLDLARAAIPYTAFSTAMIVGRLLINKLSKKWHLSSIAQISGFAAGFAILIAVVVGVPLASTDVTAGLLVVSIFFAIAGLGAAPLVPSFFSLAGSVKGLNTAQVLARMSLVNSVAILVVKILMGATTQSFGVSATYGFGIVSMFACGIIAGVLVKRSKRNPPESAYPATGAMMIVEE